MIPTPSESDCILILVRHGATANNLANPPILQGRSVDCHLSDTGVSQAKSVGVALAKQSIQACFSSPLVRARETAQWIARPHGLDVQAIAALTEVNVGDWESKSWGDVEAEDPDLYQKFMADPATHGYKNGESLSDVQRRVVPAFQQALEAHLGKTIVIVAHNVVNRVFLASAMGLEIQAAREISQDNCGINILKRSPGKVQVKTLNSTLHMP